jgi:hypothetical protein
MRQWEEVFSMRSVRQLCEAKIKVLMGEVFSVRSVPRCYKQDNSKIELVVRQSSAIKDVNTEAEGLTALEAITRQRLAKTQQTEKTY